ncbi:MAG: branched-chain amino acid ABC transporter permease [Actinomycetes bacterium]|jgi:branched-chain amino acid transport system permease protein|nr:branched-chain amino acid ABC transporter permease [Actinomycetes bacterium]
MKRFTDWLLRRSTVWLLLAIFLIGSFVIWWLNIPLIEDMFTVGAITLIMVMGFQMFMGNSGILSWSFVGYVGIGAFVSAICSMQPQLKSMQIPVMYDVLVKIHMPFPVALVVGAVVAALIAAVIAWPLMRLSDAVGAITQFALLIVINVLLAQWQEVTNGPRTFTLGGTRLTTFWVAVLVAAASIVVAYFFKESSWGLRLRASRDDRYAATATGVNVIAMRYVAYVISAAIGAIAGGLYSHYILSITAASFYMSQLFQIMSMVVIGGSMSVSGAFFGTVLVTLADQGLRQFEFFLTQQGANAYGITEIVLAILMILFLILRPGGIAGGRELSLAGLAGRGRKRKQKREQEEPLEPDTTD